MSTELTKKLYCISVRNGVEIWVEHERASILQSVLSGITQHKFIKFEDETFNTADLIGVFSAGSMADVTRRKNGGYQCEQMSWHSKGEKCECIPKAQKALQEARQEAIRNCTNKCSGGFIIVSEDSSAPVARPCPCQEPFNSSTAST